VSDAERKVAAFVGAYEALCLEHGLCVVMVHEAGGVERFAVGVLTTDKAADRVLAQSCEEMRLGPIKLLDGEPA
jgi:hypothetical protein